MVAGARRAVPPADRGPADHRHAARRLPVRGGRFGRLGPLPHGLRLRRLERRRRADPGRLRGGPPLRPGRPQARLRPDPQGAVADRQGGPQIRRLPRRRHPAPGRARPDHPVPVHDASSPCAWPTTATRRSSNRRCPTPARACSNSCPRSAPARRSPSAKASPCRRASAFHGLPADRLPKSQSGAGCQLEHGTEHRRAISSTR